MKVSASAYNALVAQYLAGRLVSTLVVGGGRWAHPWRTRVEWNAERKRFEARVNPGFVDNGRECEVLASVSADEAPAATRARLADAEPGTLNAERLDAFLTESPALAIGETRLVEQGVPEFFRARGVAEVELPSEEDIELGITEIAPGIEAPDPDEQRLLRAADIVLSQQRPQNVVDWTVAAPETGSIAQFSLGVKGGLAPHARLAITRELADTNADPLLQLRGELDDDGVDRILVATVFLLGPPGMLDAEAKVDAAWEPHVRHGLFWNAQYLFTPAVTAPQQNLTLDLGGLGGGVSQLLVNQILASYNDQTNAAIQALLAQAGKGRFVTPGHRTPPPWDSASSLDPPFPFKGLP